MIGLLRPVAFAALLQGSTGSAQAPVTPVGVFASWRFTEEHQYGAEVRLWRVGDRLLGLFFQKEGLVGDLPTGLLEQVGFEAATGRLSFEAQLSTGLHGCRAHPLVPSWDLFRFEGRLSDTALAGVLAHQDLRHREIAPRSEQVTFRRSEERLATLPSEAAWQRAAEGCVRFALARDGRIREPESAVQRELQQCLRLRAPTR